MTDQKFPVNPPTQNDGKLVDFAEIVQRNCEELFNISHTHPVRETAPSTDELEIGVPVTVLLSGTYYLYVRVSSTQLARVALTLV